MTMAGTGEGEGARRLRALTAVVALYALAMQAFLGGIAGLPVGSPALPFDLPCLGQDVDRSGADPAAPKVPHRPHACCTAACPAAGTPPPLPVAAAIAWPPDIVVRPARHGEGAASARAPPSPLASARAPPPV